MRRQLPRLQGAPCSAAPIAAVHHAGAWSLPSKLSYAQTHKIAWCKIACCSFTLSNWACSMVCACMSRVHGLRQGCTSASGSQAEGFHASVLTAELAYLCAERRRSWQGLHADAAKPLRVPALLRVAAHRHRLHAQVQAGGVRPLQRHLLGHHVHRCGLQQLCVCSPIRMSAFQHCITIITIRPASVFLDSSSTEEQELQPIVQCDASLSNLKCGAGHSCPSCV